MSTFIAEIKTIDAVHPHTNADRLEVVSFADLAYTLVVSKGAYKDGDQILYIPLDAVLPAELIEELGVAPYLSGSEKNVVQTAVLRGIASQGIPAPLSVLTSRAIALDTPAEEITKLLGITKYDPEPKEAENAVLYPLPGNRHSYDIENAERYAKVVDFIIENQIEVIVTEKLEGCHVGAYRDPVDDKTSLFIRNNTIIEEEGKTNPICKLLRQCQIEQLAETLARSQAMPVSIHAEALGAGSGRDYYGLGKPYAPIFDVGVKKPSGWTYLSEDEIIPFGFTRVPILFRGQLQDFLQGKSIVEMSHGPSAINPKKLREGIVIKPAVETTIPLELGGGRLIVKQRDPIYPEEPQVTTHTVIIEGEPYEVTIGKGQPTIQRKEAASQ